MYGVGCKFLRWIISEYKSPSVCSVCCQLLTSTYMKSFKFTVAAFKIYEYVFWNQPFAPWIEGFWSWVNVDTWRWHTRSSKPCTCTSWCVASQHAIQLAGNGHVQRIHKLTKIQHLLTYVQRGQQSFCYTCKWLRLSSWMTLHCLMLRKVATVATYVYTCTCMPLKMIYRGKIGSCCSFPLPWRG